MLFSVIGLWLATSSSSQGLGLASCLRLDLQSDSQGLGLASSEIQEFDAICVSYQAPSFTLGVHRQSISRPNLAKDWLIRHPRSHHAHLPYHRRLGGGSASPRRLDPTAQSGEFVEERKAEGVLTSRQEDAPIGIVGGYEHRHFCLALHHRRRW